MQLNKAGRLAGFISSVMLGAFLSVSAENTLTLNVGGATYTINKSLYGVLMENYGRCIYDGIYNTSVTPNTNGMRNDVIQAFKDAGVGCIEFPGGCYADEYDWTKGIGTNRASGYGLGTDEYFQLCSLTNAIPYITANIQTGTSSEMNLWLNYIDTNSQHTWWKDSIKFWKIGNEEWSPCGSMTQSTYQTTFNTFYTSESATWRSKMRHIMDGGSGGGWISADASYMSGLTDSTGISYHSYAVVSWTDMGPSYGFTTTQYYNQLKTAWNMNSNISSYSTAIASYDPNYKVGLCVDEWGAWYTAVSMGSSSSFNWSTVRDAIIVGMNLNIFNNNCRRVKMALMAQPVNEIQALVLTNPSSPYTMKVTPAFYVYKMFKVHQGAKMVPISSSNISTNQSIPVINASASIDKSNNLHISLVNTHDASAQDLTITLSNLPSTVSYTSSSWSGQEVNGSSITSGITSFTSTDTVTLHSFTGFTVSGSTITVTLPAHSVVMLTASSGVAVKDYAASAKPVDVYSVNANNGKISVKYASSANMPIRLTLLSLDGRMIAQKSEMSRIDGWNMVELQPNVSSSGLYVVRMESAGNAVKSQTVMLTK
jgi:alpha-L-arabinofuranosidase